MLHNAIGVEGEGRERAAGSARDDDENAHTLLTLSMCVRFAASERRSTRFSAADRQADGDAICASDTA